MTTKFAQIAAFITLLLGPLVFGFLGKPTEMGLCILAASIALAFSNIEKLKRFKGAGFEAEMLERQVEAMVAKEAEPDVQRDTSVSVKGYGLDQSTRAVVQALGNSKYTWRTVNGIALETGQTPPAVRKALDWLMLNDLAVQIGTTRNLNWGLSEEGRALANHLLAANS